MLGGEDARDTGRSFVCFLPGRRAGGDGDALSFCRIAVMFEEADVTGRPSWRCALPLAEGRGQVVTLPGDARRRMGRGFLAASRRA